MNDIKNFEMISIHWLSIGITHLRFFRGIFVKALIEQAHVEYCTILDMAMSRIVKAKINPRKNEGE